MHCALTNWDSATDKITQNDYCHLAECRSMLLHSSHGYDETCQKRIAVRYPLCHELDIRRIVCTF